MTRKEQSSAVAAAPEAPELPVVLDLLRITVTSVRTARVNDAGLYTVGEYAWPGERVALAVPDSAAPLAAA